MRQMKKRRLFDHVGGLLRAVHDELEADFLAASRDPSLIPVLGHKLQQHNVFEEYQDRFFALVKSNKGK
jgi:hypothetical protein